MIKSIQKCEDQLVIKGLQSPEDNKAIACLYQGDYFKIARHYVLTNSGSMEDFRDVYQESLAVLYEIVNRPGFALTSPLKALIMGIVRKLWLKELRRRRRRPESLQSPEELRMLSEQDEQLLNGIDETVDDTVMEAVSSCLDKMPEDKKKIIIYKYFYNMSMREIAEELGLSSGKTAKSLRYRWMKNLQACVKQKLRKNG